MKTRNNNRKLENVHFEDGGCFSKDRTKNWLKFEDTSISNFGVKCLFTFFGLMLSLSLFSQHRVIYGKVYHFENLSLNNVAVSALRAGTFTLTDSTGHFAIVCNERDVLEFDGKTFYKERKRVNLKTDSVFVNMRYIDSPNNALYVVGGMVVSHIGEISP
jgi:hypothetical protein